MGLHFQQKELWASRLCVKKVVAWVWTFFFILRLDAVTEARNLKLAGSSEYRLFEYSRIRN
jgi:hypothetical protein